MIQSPTKVWHHMYHVAILFQVPVKRDVAYGMRMGDIQWMQSHVESMQHVQEWELVVFYLVVGQMFLMIVPCLVF